MIYKYNVISCLRWQRVGFFREGSASLMLSSLKEDTQEYYYMSEGISDQLNNYSLSHCQTEIFKSLPGIQLD